MSKSTVLTEKEFVSRWYEKLLKTIKIFPGDFIEGIETGVTVLTDKRITLGPEFFGTYQLLNSNGELVITAASLSEAKYYIYASISTSAPFQMPVKTTDTENVICLYEKYFMNLISKIAKDHSKNFPASERSQSVAIDILQRLKLVLL